MSWITVVWPMASAVCLTLAAIHFAIWSELSALGAAGNGFVIAVPAPIKSKAPLSNPPEKESVLLAENAFEPKLANSEAR